MNILSVENLSKAYTERILIDHVTFGIEDTDKIGIIGVNGTGKSTLIKLLAGLETPDTGKVIKGNAVHVEYLPQVVTYDPELTVLEAVFKGTSPNLKRVAAYEKAVMDPETPSELMVKLTQEMDANNAWSLEHEAKSVLTQLGIDNFDQKVGTLSGGNRKRVALASALITPSQLLILDEPTNHLDAETILWLEMYLKQRKGALIMITHDRYFLERVVNRILEIDQGKLYSYPGNYGYYLEKKQERMALVASEEIKKQNLYRRELAWIRRGARARSTKQKARIDRFESLEGSLETDGKEALTIALAGTRLGRKTIEAKHIYKAYGNESIIEDFSFTVLRDERLGILGPNGIGKSTLINLLTGKNKPDQGSVEMGTTVRIGYFTQESPDMDLSQRAIEYIQEGGEVVKVLDGTQLTAAQMMERFLFDKTLQWMPIEKLSGGERRRLQLLRVLMEAPNILVLDEPTNDLDITTLTVLEAYLEGFPGAVIIVSHDRYLLDKLVDKLLVFEGPKQIVEHTGNYAYFETLNQQAKAPAKEPSPSGGRNKPKSEKVKFTFSEQKEWQEIDGKIAETEQAISQLESEIQKTATDYVRLDGLIKEKNQLEDQLESLMNRWVYLSEIHEEMGGAN
ncbi:ABC-F family ATP-binding cassette domain-containing protein [Fusibacter tunisiensis]|uniref:ATP-binding cassette subfamily F protein uup n=1 Tax=Fusibacter tunisiensis TaxID=1008308 RepID=A0ABS2MSQ9_9FIRM|nr:ABC-F family ATP-binding cassette domain-containing protein [Fusibacter tunisiensis]MBM7562466.1 ATP-binding cassette subfamily F protein uup [Fusibacter tunisiensis]